MAYIKLGLTAIAILLCFIILWIIRVLVNRRLSAKVLGEQGKSVVYRISRIAVIVFFVIAITAIWGFSLQNIWIVITSALGILAVAFFAVWSILSNIIAGLLLSLSRKIHIGDTITFPEEKISGTVEEISYLIVVLRGRKGHIHVPNNLFFQRIIIVKH